MTAAEQHPAPTIHARSLARSGALPRSDDPDTVLARVTALKAMSTLDLEAQWRVLFTAELPPYNCRYLESRLAYRIQELAYGGLKPETRTRLRALGEQLDGGNVKVRRTRLDDRPILGTQLVRAWQGSSTSPP